MTEVRDAVTLHPETVTKAETLAKESQAKRRKPPSRRKNPVSKTKVHPEVWQKALALAGKDRSRLVVESPTSVLVRNP